MSSEYKRLFPRNVVLERIFLLLNMVLGTLSTKYFVDSDDVPGDAAAAAADEAGDDDAARDADDAADDDEASDDDDGMYLSSIASHPQLCVPSLQSPPFISMLIKVFRLN